MTNSSSWLSRVEDYITYRRRNGFDIIIEAERLRHFAQFAEQCWREDRLSIELAVAWARTSKRQTPITWARRIELLRGFAKYWIKFDPSTEIPPCDLFGPAHRRLTPHIYTKEEICTLMEAATQLTPHNGMRPVTCRTVFGLLASIGLRISEVVNLTCHDIDLEAGLLSIRKAKFHKSRIIPLHPSATSELRSYAQSRNKITTICDNEPFFLFDGGIPINQRQILYALHDLCRQLGWHSRGDYPNHRLQDFRHTFIVHSILQFYKSGVKVDDAVLALSNYVGHAEIKHTYWYFTGIPELMAVAAERFHRYAQGRPL